MSFGIAQHLWIPNATGGPCKAASGDEVGSVGHVDMELRRAITQQSCFRGIAWCARKESHSFYTPICIMLSY